MTMTPYNTDLTRSLKWLHNKAPNLQSLIEQKADWYAKYQDGFWTNWEQNVFDIRTANAFGLVVWCIILGLPLSAFNFEAITNAWAYGNQRGNFKDGGGHVEPITFVDVPVFYSNGVVVPSGNYTLNETTDIITFTTAPALNAKLSWTATVEDSKGRQLIVKQARQFGVGDGSTHTFSLIPLNAADYDQVGSNFYGGGNQSVALLNEIRYACQLRYVALVSNGRQAWINQMLRYIFNKGAAWDFPGKKYFYLHDESGAVQSVVSANIWRSDWEGNVLLSPNARTNYVWPANQIAASNQWTLANATIVNSNGPDGTANGAATITPTAGGTAATAHPTNAATGLPLNSLATYSIFAKAGTAPTSRFEVYDGTLTTLLAGVTVTWNGTSEPTLSNFNGASPIAGSAKVYDTGVAGWFRIAFSFNNGTNSTLNNKITADAANGTGTVIVAYPQGEMTGQAGAFINTTTGAASLTDYTLNTTTGGVVMGVAPVAGATLTWSGTWNWATATTPQPFGVGNATQTSFTLSQPPGAVQPITTPYYMEYRVGANLSLSAQFINLLNNTDFGIMPTCAGIRYQVVQES